MKLKIFALFVLIFGVLIIACGGFSPAQQTPAEKSDPADPPDGTTEKPLEDPKTRGGETVDDPENDEAKSEPPKTAKVDQPPADKPPEVKTPKPKPDLPHPALFDPNLAIEKAPQEFLARCDTTKGQFMIEVNRSWSPQGADRFYNLIKIGYFKEVAFFRVIDRFMAQFGIHGDPKVNEVWQNANILDDPVIESNQRGYVSLAKTGAPNSRSVQFFINLVNNGRLDGMGFSPFGRVVAGMDVVDSIYKGYGESVRRGGRGPDQGQVQARGNDYLKSSFPELDYIQSVTIVEK